MRSTGRAHGLASAPAPSLLASYQVFLKPLGPCSGRWHQAILPAPQKHAADVFLRKALG